MSLGGETGPAVRRSTAHPRGLEAGLPTWILIGTILGRFVGDFWTMGLL